MEPIDYNLIINSLQKQLQQQRICIKSLLQSGKMALDHNCAIERVLETLKSESRVKCVNENATLETAYAIANGKPLSKEDAQKLKIEDFDIVVDLVRQSVKVRKDPLRNTPFVPCLLYEIGLPRLGILAYMVARPGVCISFDDIARYCISVQEIEPGSFSKNICLFRKAISTTGCKFKYIITIHGGAETGHAAYKIDENVKCLVIRKIF